MSFVLHRWSAMISGLISGLISDAGQFAWPLFVVASAALLIATERIVALYARSGCPRAHADGCLAPSIGVWVSRWLADDVFSGPDQTRRAGAELRARVIPGLWRRLGILDVLATVATLIGLLGTLEGLILGFDHAIPPAHETKQTLLAAAIALALSTTFLGLLIAVPTKLVAGLLRERAASIQREVERACAAAVLDAEACVNGPASGLPAGPGDAGVSEDQAGVPVWEGWQFGPEA